MPSEIVAKQKAAGFHAITDGEFRRKFWHLDFMWGFEGVAHEKDGGGLTPFTVPSSETVAIVSSLDV